MSVQRLRGRRVARLEEQRSAGQRIDVGMDSGEQPHVADAAIAQQPDERRGDIVHRFVGMKRTSKAFRKMLPQRLRLRRCTAPHGGGSRALGRPFAARTRRQHR